MHQMSMSSHLQHVERLITFAADSRKRNSRRGCSAEPSELYTESVRTLLQTHKFALAERNSGHGLCFARVSTAYTLFTDSMLLQRPRSEPNWPQPLLHIMYFMLISNCLLTARILLQ